MAINFNSINLEIIDINTNAEPDLYINQNGITFSRRILEDLNYPQNVQYCLDATNKVFAIRACKSNEAKATPFSKPKAEQTSTLNTTNKNLREIVVTMIPDFDPKKRYKVTGQYEPEGKVMYFDMATAEESNFRNNVAKGE